MAERVLSVEMGYSLTKVCEIERNGKTPKIINSFVIATPDGMLRDGAVEINDEFVNQFMRMMTVKHIKTRKAIFTIASSKIATREAVIPYVKENKIVDVVRANLSEYFPVDASQYMFSHSILEVTREEVQLTTPAIEDNAETKAAATEETQTDADDKKKKAAKPVKVTKNVGKPNGYKLLILAAPKQLIQSYERLAKNLNLEIESMDYNGNSIYQAAKEECKEGVQLIIKVDERSSLLMVLEDGVIALNRTIPYGIDEAIATLGQCKELGDTNTYEKALEVARRKTVILSSFDDNGNSTIIDLDNETKENAIKSDKKAVTESLRALVGGILRVIDYYNSNHSDRPIEKMYVTGIGADFSGLSTLLTHESGLKIKNLTHLAGIDIEKVFKDVTYGEYVTVIGASIEPLSFYADHADESKGKKGSGSSLLGDVDTTIVAIVVAAIGVIAAIVMFFIAFLPYTKEKKLKEGYEQTIMELQPAYDVYLQYKALDNDVAVIRQMDQMTDNRNEYFVSFLSKLEVAMPESFNINSMSIDKETVVMDVSVATKDEVAYALTALKQMEGFISADLTSVTEMANESGDILYSFSVEMKYAPMYEEETEAVEVTEGQEAVVAADTEEVE